MTNDSSILSWDVPCNQDFALAITIGANTYRMKQEQLISSNSTSTVCTSLVKGWADPSVRAYIFGRPFVSSAYIAYNAMQDPSADQIGVARRSADDSTAPIVIQHPGVSGSTVVMSVVGSILGVSVTAAFLFLFIRWRRRARSDKASSKPRVKKKKYMIEPFTDSARRNSTTPLIPVTGSRGVFVVEQGEIGGEPGTRYAPTERWGVQNGLSPRMPDRKSPLPAPSSPHLVLVRQSQISSSSYSPEPSPRFDMHRVSAPVPVRPEPQRYDSPDSDEPAPPPYEREQAGLLS
jgi:hypothetical protein